MDAIKGIFGFYMTSLIVVFAIGFSIGFYASLSLTKLNFENGTYLLAKDVNCTK